MRHEEAEKVRGILAAGRQPPAQSAIPESLRIPERPMFVVTDDWVIGSPTSDPVTGYRFCALGDIQSRHPSKSFTLQGDGVALGLEADRLDPTRHEREVFRELKEHVNRALSDYWLVGMEPTGTFFITLPSYVLGFRCPIDMSIKRLVEKFCENYSDSYGGDPRLEIYYLRQASDTVVEENVLKVSVTGRLDRERHYLDHEKPAEIAWKKLDIFYSWRHRVRGK